MNSILSVAYGGSKQSGDALRQDHCFHMGASVPEKDEGVVYTYGHRPASDFEGIDKKPPPPARSDRWGRFIRIRISLVFPLLSLIVVYI